MHLFHKWLYVLVFWVSWRWQMILARVVDVS